LERFRREARAACALNHPAVCTLYDVGEHDGRPFLELEWVDGQTLRAAAGPRPDLARLVPLVRQVAGALRAAHAAGIVHRDVKPENLMVRPDGYVKVLDFGVARLLPGPAAADPIADTDPGTLVGTVRYMSPEQARAEPVGSAADVFALGIVLYELATGRHPFDAGSRHATLHAIMTEPPLPPARLNPEIPAALDGLIVQMLAKDARLRPTAAEVDAALAGADGPRGTAPAPAAPSTVVGRDRERAALRAALDAAAAGRGSLVCVAGEPGIGKTTLIEDFLREVADGCGTARGRCSERLGGAEAYLPVLEALDHLLGGPAGEAAARALRVLAPAWYVRVAPPAAVDPTPAEDVPQERLKRELLAFLREASRPRPLVLFLDDVHWADASTADLLAYVGARCGDLPVLILLTYRLTELLVGPHPLVPVQLELQRHGVCRVVALGFLGPADVDRYLALAFPGHDFPPDFAALVHARTEGNPLFLVDLLRYLRDRGVIAPAGDGWALARAVPDLHSDLPESVRSMVRTKLALLGTADLRLLSAASVQGTEFDSAVVARVLKLDPADVEERLEPLDRVHGLVRLRREQEFPDGTLSLRYQFVHGLYHEVLAAALQPTRKAAWSAAAAAALADLHGDNAAAVAGEVALLYEAARDPARASDAFLQAARNAVRATAHRDAVGLARRGLRLLAGLPETPDRDARELALQMALGLQLQITEGYAAPAGRAAYERARELCQRSGEARLLFPVLWGLWLDSKARSDLPAAKLLAGELAALADELGDPALVSQSHQASAVTTLCLGEPAATVGHMERGVALYDPQRHGLHTDVFGHDPGVACRAFGAVALWLLGFPDRALHESGEAVRLGHELSQPNTQALALHFAAMLRQFRREPVAAGVLAELSAAIAADQGFSFWHAGGTVLRGWAAAVGGDPAGVELVRDGLAAWRATGSVTYETYFLGLLAEVLGRHGYTAEARRLVDEALALAGRTSEGLFAAELHRLRGEFLLAGGDAVGRSRAEGCFREALATARRQGARSLELRAAMSLARLLAGRGQADEGRRLVTEAVAPFTEGWDTPDLRDARAFLA
ncbi:MAG TPA: AAA family ATPase, partial [Gemmataceae bacterium]